MTKGNAGRGRHNIRVAAAGRDTQQMQLKWRVAALTVLLFAAVWLLGAGSAVAGPRVHQIRSAWSPDGLTWYHEHRILFEAASVPAVLMMPDGTIRMYFVDGTNNTIGCAASTDQGLTYTRTTCTFSGMPAGTGSADPAPVLLPDGRVRLYTFNAAGQSGSPDSHTVGSAISTDGVNFTFEGVALNYPGVVDPDVFWNGQQWIMYVFSGTAGTTVMATSSDGKTFSNVKPSSLASYGFACPVKLDDGRLRLYAFDQPGSTRFDSFLSTDGITWSKEAGTRLEAPSGHQITDSQAVKLPSGIWRMVYKISGMGDTTPTAFGALVSKGGSTEALQLGFTLRPDSADVGKAGAYYIGALIGDGIYMFDGTKWTQWTGGTMPAYKSGTLGNTDITLFSGHNLKAYPGARFWAGYGTSSDDMLKRGKMAFIYEVPK